MFRIEKMCYCLEVSKSGYYTWLNRVPSKRSLSNERLLHAIRVVHRKSRKNYGSRRVTHELKSQGVTCDQNRVARLMKEHGIKAKRSRKFKATTNSKHRFPVAPNLLKQEFRTERPDAVWVVDITYIWTAEGWLYLAGVLDLFSRQIVGWSSDKRMTRQLTIDALKKAIIRRRPKAGLIHHSDRGSQYAALEYQQLLKTHKMMPSMSRKGDCYDNAVMESFFKTLKAELVYQTNFATREEAKKMLFDYIEIYYNRQRLHSTLGYKTPVEFERMEISH